MKSTGSDNGKGKLFDPYVSEHEERKVMKVGGSVVVPIPSKLRKRLNIAPGDRMRINEGAEGTIIMKKVKGVWSERVANRS